MKSRVLLIIELYLSISSRVSVFMMDTEFLFWQQIRANWIELGKDIHWIIIKYHCIRCEHTQNGSYTYLYIIGVS